MEPQVSVIIPCFNGAWCIKALADNLNQCVPEHFEIVFVDDGSTDGSLEIFSALVPQARCFKQGNRGLGATRNRAAHEARGQFLQLLDVDDTIIAGKLEAQLRFLEANNLDVVYSNWRMVVSRKGTVIHEPFVNAEYSGDLVEALLGGWWFPPNAALIRKSAYNAVQGCDPSLGNTCEDFDLWVRVAISGANFGYMHGDYANYHRYDDRKSMSRVNRTEFLQGEAFMIRKAMSILSDLEQDTDARKRAAARRLHHVARSAYAIDRQWYQGLFDQIKTLDPEFHPPGSMMYRIIWRALGHDLAEKVALRLRRIRR